ncbi:MAG: CpsB/CapC family capsule biosynthesis tyrosine phosphatase, partial [Bacillota bacterium]|nr:CpsB/CapC family capsule biosynthesis tyrosine phosphatase [Bacillota bacterium]
TPIIAHPERNAQVLENPAVIDPFLQLGCLLQLNAASVTGHNGREAQDVAKDLLTTRRAHFIASDAHSPRSRPPKLAGARRQTAQWLGETETARLFDTNPEAVLADEPLDVPQPLPRKQQPRGVISRILQHIAFY